MQKKIYGQIGRLKKDKVEEYKNLHKKCWPGVLDMIQKCHLNNYSIFIHGQDVFSYFEYEGNDFENDMKKMEDDEETQKWWRHTHPCFETFTYDKQEFFADMDQIFYFSTK